MPSVTSDGEICRGRDWAVSVIVRYRPRVEITEPDHGLVQVRPARAVGSEEIVGNISYECLGSRARLRPMPGRL